MKKGIQFNFTLLLSNSPLALERSQKCATNLPNKSFFSSSTFFQLLRPLLHFTLITWAKFFLSLNFVVVVAAASFESFTSFPSLIFLFLCHALDASFHANLTRGRFSIQSAIHSFIHSVSQSFIEPFIHSAIHSFNDQTPNYYPSPVSRWLLIFEQEHIFFCSCRAKQIRLDEREWVSEWVS